MSFTSNPALLINQLPISVEFPTEQERFLETITLLYKRIANAVNSKEGSFYLQTEFTNLNQYYSYLPAPAAPFTPDPNNFRIVYRKVFDMIALNGGAVIAPGATVSFAHGITGITQSTRITGSAINSDAPIKYLSLPYVSATLITDQVQIYCTPTNVVLVNGATQTALTSAVIVFEYLKT